MNIFVKAYKVIMSCETKEQLKVSKKYLELAQKYLKTTQNKRLLNNFYLERMSEFNK